MLLKTSAEVPYPRGPPLQDRLHIASALDIYCPYPPPPDRSPVPLDSGRVDAPSAGTRTRTEKPGANARLEDRKTSSGAARRRELSRGFTLAETLRPPDVVLGTLPSTLQFRLENPSSRDSSMHLKGID